MSLILSPNWFLKIILFQYYLSGWLTIAVLNHTAHVKTLESVQEFTVKASEEIASKWNSYFQDR